MTGDGILFAVIAWAALAYIAVSLVQWALYLRKRWGGDDVTPAIECPRCKEVSLECYGYIYLRNGSVDTEWECSDCGLYEIHFYRKQPQ